MKVFPKPPVRWATTADAGAIAALLDRFNREYDTPTPGVATLTARLERLMSEGEAIAYLAGPGPDGVVLGHYRPSVWWREHDFYVAELYVTPEQRRQGYGRALLMKIIEGAQATGAAIVDLVTGETDLAARALYEQLGFSNREHQPDGPRMLAYELVLPRQTYGSALSAPRLRFPPHGDL